MRSSAILGAATVALAVMLTGCKTTPASAAAAAQQQQPADLVVTNAKVFTVDEQRPRASAFAVKDGRFIAVGGDAEMAAYRGEKTRVIDARGHIVIPGLNDSHAHVVRGGRFYNLELRWDGVESLERALAMVREQAGRTPKGQWVRVIGGWSPYQFKEKRMPTVKELNEAAPDTPTFVLFLYSQGMLNRAAVQALGLTEATPAPEGGRFEFVDGGAILHAEPNPLILYQMIARPPQLSAEEQLNSTLHFYRELNRLGMTSAVDPGGGGHAFPKDYGASQAVAHEGQMSVRIGYYLFPQTAGKEAEDFRRWTSEYQAGRNEAAQLEHGFELEGGGEFLAHSVGDWENFLAPRPDLEARKAAGQDPAGDLRTVATLLVGHNWPLRQHATYGESIKVIMDVFEQVNREQGRFAPRWAIDHAETVRDEELRRIKAMGGGIAIQNRMAYAGEYFVDRYGKDAARDAPPIRKMLAMGIPVGAGTDGTRVSSYNPWPALYWLVSGKTIGGTQLFADDNRLTREEALRLFTVGSAWLTREETVKGRIAPGQYADFAVLSDDYFTVPEEQIKNLESLLTVVGGRVVYAAEPFEDVAPPALPPVRPAWSPVAHFGGYQNPKKTASPR
ncbi:amidohydrolase [Archangium sp.]|uniref:amidohydrolase n=1 Tax=Archangium sp. TaxID=1872627 RepID=UPI00389A5B6F